MLALSGFFAAHNDGKGKGAKTKQKQIPFGNDKDGGVLRRRMRGFFAALRMTAKGKAKGQRQTQKQVQTQKQMQTQTQVQTQKQCRRKFPAGVTEMLF